MESLLFVGNPYPRIYIPTNLYTIICLISIKIILITLSTKLRPHGAGKFWLPTNIVPPRIKIFHSKEKCGNLNFPPPPLQKRYYKLKHTQGTTNISC